MPAMPDVPMSPDNLRGKILVAGSYSTGAELAAQAKREAEERSAAAQQGGPGVREISVEFPIGAIREEFTQALREVEAERAKKAEGEPVRPPGGAPTWERVLLTLIATAETIEEVREAAAKMGAPGEVVDSILGAVREKIWGKGQVAQPEGAAEAKREDLPQYFGEAYEVLGDLYSRADHLSEDEGRRFSAALAIKDRSVRWARKEHPFEGQKGVVDDYMQKLLGDDDYWRRVQVGSGMRGENTMKLVVDELERIRRWKEDEPEWARGITNAWHDGIAINWRLAYYRAKQNQHVGDYAANIRDLEGQQKYLGWGFVEDPLRNVRIEALAQRALAWEEENGLAVRKIAEAAAGGQREGVAWQERLRGQEGAVFSLERFGNVPGVDKEAMARLVYTLNDWAKQETLDSYSVSLTLNSIFEGAKFPASFETAVRRGIVPSLRLNVEMKSGRIDTVVRALNYEVKNVASGYITPGGVAEVLEADLGARRAELVMWKALGIRVGGVNRSEVPSINREEFGSEHDFSDVTNLTGDEIQRCLSVIARKANCDVGQVIEAYSVLRVMGWAHGNGHLTGVIEKWADTDGNGSKDLEWVVVAPYMETTKVDMNDGKGRRTLKSVVEDPPRGQDGMQAFVQAMRGLSETANISLYKYWENLYKVRMGMLEISGARTQGYGGLTLGYQERRQAVLNKVMELVRDQIIAEGDPTYERLTDEGRISKGPPILDRKPSELEAIRASNAKIKADWNKLWGRKPRSGA